VSTFWKLTAGLIGGACISLLGYFDVMMVVVPSNASESLVGFLLIGFFVLGLMLALTAPTPGKAWRRTMVTAAVLSFCMPISVFVSSIVLGLTTGAGENGASMAGAAVGGTLATGMAGVIGFFLGAVFLVIGLVSGREPKVVYVQQLDRNPDRFG